MGKLIICLGVCAIALAGATFSFPAAAQNWTEFCSEGDTCDVLGTRPVRYGANGKFNYGVASRIVRCDDRTFGDPAPDATKRCSAYYTAEELVNLNASRDKDARIRALEQEVQATQAELEEANAELDELYRELRRDRRRDVRRERRGRPFREQFGPVIIERR